MANTPILDPRSTFQMKTPGNHSLCLPQPPIGKMLGLQAECSQSAKSVEHGIDKNPGQEYM